MGRMTTTRRIDTWLTDMDGVLVHEDDPIAGAAEFIDTYHRLLDVVIDGYRREGKRYMTVAIGCTGGKHRSVAIAEALAARLQGGDQLSVRVLHRDLGRE